MAGSRELGSRRRRRKKRRTPPEQRAANATVAVDVGALVEAEASATGQRSAVVVVVAVDVAAVLPVVETRGVVTHQPLAMAASSDPWGRLPRPHKMGEI